MSKDLWKPLKREPQRTLSLKKRVGHTDNIGEASYNQQLSEKRALSVKEYLIKKGVTPERLITMGQGGKEPIASNDTEEGRSKNRRVVFILMK